MDYEQFLDAVTQRTALSRDRAEVVSKTTLQVLAEQVNPEVMSELLAPLPSQLASVRSVPPDQRQHLSLDEFCQRVSQFAGVGDPERARAHVHSVFAVLADASGSDRLMSAVAGLRPEYQALLPTEGGGFDEFAARVQKRVRSSSREEAVAGTHATLVALADRLSEGQAAELAAVLPPELRPYLNTGKGSAQPFDKAGFLGRVGSEAGLEGAELAETHARAVLATVAEWAAGEELDDTLAQLPPELADMFG